MLNKLRPNYIKSSNLIFASAGLGIVNFIILPEISKIPFNIIVCIITGVLIIGLGFLVRSVMEWVKYLLLVFTLIGVLIGFPGMFMGISIIVFSINILQSIMQIYAVILLFKVPKSIT